MSTRAGWLASIRRAGSITFARRVGRRCLPTRHSRLGQQQFRRQPRVGIEAPRCLAEPLPAPGVLHQVHERRVLEPTDTASRPLHRDVGCALRPGVRSWGRQWPRRACRRHRRPSARTPPRARKWRAFPSPTNRPGDSRRTTAPPSPARPSAAATAAQGRATTPRNPPRHRKRGRRSVQAIGRRRSRPTSCGAPRPRRLRSRHA